MRPVPLLNDLWLFQDTCNVYVIRAGDRAVAVDFGSGEWMAQLASLGIKHLDHVFLTHHHADQCFGLQSGAPAGCQVHAPAGEEKLLDAALMKQFGTLDHAKRGCPASYSALPDGLSGVRFDMAPSADLFWETRRIRYLNTPGHSPSALSVVMDINGRQVVFCGDAAHAGATIVQPYQLEWDHWTGSGALAAWQGIIRLRDIAIDLLCPSHGPVVAEHARDLMVSLGEETVGALRGERLDLRGRTGSLPLTAAPGLRRAPHPR